MAQVNPIQSFVHSFISNLPKDLKKNIHPVLEEVQNWVGTQTKQYNTLFVEVQKILSQLSKDIQLLHFHSSQENATLKDQFGLVLVDQLFQLQKIVKQLVQVDKIKIKIEEAKEIIYQYNNRTAVINNSKPSKEQLPVEMKIDHNNLQQIFESHLDSFQSLSFSDALVQTEEEKQQIKSIIIQIKTTLKNMYSDSLKQLQQNKEIQKNRLSPNEFQPLSKTHNDQDIQSNLLDSFYLIEKYAIEIISKSQNLSIEIEKLIQNLIQIEVSAFPEHMIYIFCIYWVKQNKLPVKFTSKMICRQVCEDATKQSNPEKFIKEIEKMKVSYFCNSFENKVINREIPNNIDEFGVVLMNHLVSSGTIDAWKAIKHSGYTTIQLLELSLNIIKTINNL